MNSRKIFGMAILAAGMTTAQAFAANDLWLHIKVYEGKEDSKVTINLPLSVARKAGGMIPMNARHSGQIRVNDEDMSIAEFREIWRELKGQPDATFITVDERDSKVRVAKRGAYLHIEATDHEKVDIRMPITVVDALLSGSGDQFNIGAAIDALARHGEGELVTVNGDDETVRIWIDDTSEAR